MQQSFLIGITGGSGSGKTSFIHELRAAFTPTEVCIISQDDYYLPQEQQVADEQGVINYDLPKSIDKKSFLEDIKKLMNGEVVTREEYTFNNDEKEASVLTYLPAPIIIVEGLFVFHFKKIRKRLDLKIFLNAKENLKVIRRIKRDRVERNYPLDDVLYRYEHHVLPTYEKYIDPYIDLADLVVNNNASFEMGQQVVETFIRSKIAEDEKGHSASD